MKQPVHWPNNIHILALTKAELFAKLASQLPSFTQEATTSSEIGILQRATKVTNVYVPGYYDRGKTRKNTTASSPTKSPKPTTA